MMDNFFAAAINKVKAWLGFESAPPSVPPDHEVAPGEYNDLKGREEALSAKLHLQNPPRLLIKESAAPGASYNAQTDTLCMNAGSLTLLDAREQDSELAHELAHARDRRERPESMPQRDREFRADALAVLVTGDPDARISGLKKIEYAKEHDHGVMRAEIAENRGPAAARLYGSLPEFAQTTIQESSFRWRRLLRRLHLDRHPLPEERYRRIEALKEQMASDAQER
jgi:Zn-dependent protease with chaperone function